MTTFGGLRERILTDIERTSESSRVELAIQEAVRFYENERFWFNETLSVTFTTSSGAEYYDSTDATDIPFMREIDNVEVTISGNRFPLTRRDKSYLDAISVTPTNYGQPQDYSYEAGKLRFYPIPDGDYVTRISGVIAPATLSASTDSNFWTAEAEMLIRFRAKWDLWANYLRSPEDAAIARDAEMQVLNNLRQSTTRRLSTGKIRPSQF